MNWAQSSHNTPIILFPTKHLLFYFPKNTSYPISHNTPHILFPTIHLLFYFPQYTYYSISHNTPLILFLTIHLLFYFPQYTSYSIPGHTECQVWKHLFYFPQYICYSSPGHTRCQVWKHWPVCPRSLGRQLRQPFLHSPLGRKWKLSLMSWKTMLQPLKEYLTVNREMINWIACWKCSFFQEDNDFNSLIQFI